MNTNKAVPMFGKSVYYRPDGTGRDSYIKNINGGLLSHDRIHQLQRVHSNQKSQRRMKFGKGNWSVVTQSLKNTKFNHYASDGSGRDYYVKLSEGGNSRNWGNWKDHVDYKFRNSLRLDDKFSSVRSNSRDNPELGFTRSSMGATQTSRVSSKAKEAYQKYHKKQVSLTERLARPKIFLKPLPVQAYFKGTKASNVMQLMRTIS